MTKSLFLLDMFNKAKQWPYMYIRTCTYDQGRLLTCQFHQCLSYWLSLIYLNIFLYNHKANCCRIQLAHLLVETMYKWMCRSGHMTKMAAISVYFEMIILSLQPKSQILWTLICSNEVVCSTMCVYGTVKFDSVNAFIREKTWTMSFAITIWDKSIIFTRYSLLNKTMATGKI